MNEQNRYRGSGSQQRQNQGRGSGGRRDEPHGLADRGNYAGAPSERFGQPGESEWERDYGHRSQRSEMSNPDYPRFEDSARGNEYGSRELARDERGGFGQGDQTRREQDRDYRGGYGSQRDRQHEWNEGGFSSAGGSGGGSSGGGSYSREGSYGVSAFGQGAFGQGSSGGGAYGREAPYGRDAPYAGSAFRREGASGVGRNYGGDARGRTEIPWGSRGESFSENRGPSGPSYGRSSNQNSIANFGSRTRQDTSYTPGAQQTFYGRGPKGYARSDDRIREDVCERLSEHDEVDASDIEVSIQNREVTLTGTVETRRMKHLAEDIADSISGVEDVHNRISVRKALLKDLADQIMGDNSNQHHAHSGTKTTEPSTAAGSSQTSSAGASSAAVSNGMGASSGGAAAGSSVTPHFSTPVANGR